MQGWLKMWKCLCFLKIHFYAQILDNAWMFDKTIQNHFMSSRGRGKTHAVDALGPLRFWWQPRMDPWPTIFTDVVGHEGPKFEVKISIKFAENFASLS